MAILLLGVALSVGLKAYADHQSSVLRHGQITSCERGNLLRRETNRRALFHTRDTQALSEFLKDAIRARVAAGEPNDLKAADRYRGDLDLLKHVRFAQVALIDCPRVFPKP